MQSRGFLIDAFPNESESAARILGKFFRVDRVSRERRFCVPVRRRVNLSQKLAGRTKRLFLSRRDARQRPVLRSRAMTLAREIRLALGANRTSDNGDID